jgi:hypothetical protein
MSTVPRSTCWQGRLGDRLAAWYKGHMYKKVLVLAAVALAACAAYGAVRVRHQPFPPAGVACFDSFASAVQSGYSGFALPSFAFAKIDHFRCASQKGFDQYEASGIDNNGRTFYLHHAGGGMAASGADTYLDACYQQDGTVVQSIKLVGRDTEPQSGSCAWTSGFPAAPVSEYEYTAWGK